MKTAHVQLKVKGFGVITLELNAEKAPRTVRHFLSHVARGFYTDMVFHRVVVGQQIQAGCQTSKRALKTTRETVECEADNGLRNERYTVGLWRKNYAHSGAGEFFINLRDNPQFNHTGRNDTGWGYAVFGRVIEGFEVVDKIGQIKTQKALFCEDQPVEDVVIEWATQTQ